MTHEHDIKSADALFLIDPKDRGIYKQSTKKITLIQGDHNSKRFSFKMPRYISGHDTMLCNRIAVQYINISKCKTKQSEDIYVVYDMKIDPSDENYVIFSWLISGNATMYSGTLSFMLEFLCVDDSEKITYAWHTGTYSKIICDGINNSESTTKEISDILVSWELKITQNIIDNFVGKTEAAANSAVDAVNNAKGLEQAAQEAANTAQEAANSVLDEANAVKEAANNVLAEASKVQEAANDVLGEADKVQEAANTVLEEASKVQEAANDVLGNVGNAEEASKNAIAAAKEAQNSASYANANATKAQEAATNAVNAKNEAQASASSASSNASNAQASASSASNSASQAQEAASNAANAKIEAQTAANSASSNATIAQEAAQAARDTMEKAEKDAANALSIANDAKSDMRVLQNTINASTTRFNQDFKTVTTQQNFLNILMSNVGKNLEYRTSGWYAKPWDVMLPPTQMLEDDGGFKQIRVSFLVGSEYCVNCDGIEYVCSVKTIDFQGFPLVYLGNSIFIDGMIESEELKDTGEPFFIYSLLGECALVADIGTTVSIYSRMHDKIVILPETIVEHEVVNGDFRPLDITFVSPKTLKDGDLICAIIDGEYYSATLMQENGTLYGILALDKGIKVFVENGTNCTLDAPLHATVEIFQCRFGVEIEESEKLPNEFMPTGDFGIVTLTGITSANWLNGKGAIFQKNGQPISCEEIRELAKTKVVMAHFVEQYDASSGNTDTFTHTFKGNNANACYIGSYKWQANGSKITYNGKEYESWSSN